MAGLAEDQRTDDFAGNADLMELGELVLAFRQVAGGDDAEAGGTEDHAEAAEHVEDGDVGVFHAIERGEALGGGGDGGAEVGEGALEDVSRFC